MMSEGKKKTLVISGGSSGIGLAVADYFSTKGIQVYELSRSGQDRQNVRHITADVTQPESLQAAMEKIVSEVGQINYLIANAGFGIAGPIELTPNEAMKRQFNVNVFGAVNLVQAALPFMPEHAGSRIFFTSSVAAVTPIPFQAFYSATKAAVNQIALALNNELYPFGISCCAIMPGDLATGFTGVRVKNVPADSKYTEIARRSLEKMEADEINGGSPVKMAKTIYKLATQKRRPKVIRGFGAMYRFFLVLAKLLPARLMNFILRKTYAE